MQNPKVFHWLDGHSAPGSRGDTAGPTKSSPTVGTTKTPSSPTGLTTAPAKPKQVRAKKTKKGEKRQLELEQTCMPLPGVYAEDENASQKRYALLVGIGEGLLMLSMQNIESELSYAYLHAVASRAGIICECTGRHSDAAGIDAVLRVKGKLADDSLLKQFTVDVQLKATKKPPVEQQAKYSHSLEVKNYDELRSTDAAAPQLLVVLFLPEDAETWLSHNEEGLLSRRCAYWVSLLGAAATDQDSKTVYVPRANLLSVSGLRALMTRYSKREVISYAA